MCGHAVSNTARTSKSRAEYLVQQLDEQVQPESVDVQIEELKSELEELDNAIDTAYSTILSGRQTASEEGKVIKIDSAAEMQQLSRGEPEVRAEQTSQELSTLATLDQATLPRTAGLITATASYKCEHHSVLQVAKRLLEEVQKEAPTEWAAFQSQVNTLKLQRVAALSKLVDLQNLLNGVAAAEAVTASESDWDMSADEGGQDAARTAAFAAMGTTPVQIVMVTGFESFNQGLYRAAAKKVRCSSMRVCDTTC